MDKMKFWIITPSGAINYVTNPTPYRSTTGYSVYNSTIALSDAYTRRGPKCIRVTPTTSTSGVYFSGVPVSNGKTYTFSVDVKGESGKVMRIYIANGAGTARATTTFTATGNWQRLQVTWTATENQANYRLYVVRNATTGTTPFYVDGFQFEQGDKATTFFSGDTEGFEDNDFYWNGLPHASTSTRSADTRAGGALLDISDYAKVITGYGLGMGDYTQVYNELVSGGALYQKYIRKPRNFSLLLTYKDSTPGGLQAKRNAIIEACLPDTQMVLRYQGFDGTDEATQPLDIVCIPQLSHTDTPSTPIYQKDTLTFTVLDGYLRGAYKEGMGLDPYAEIANANRIIERSSDGAWSALGTGMNSDVFSLAFAPNGDLYAGGLFTTAGGVTVNRIAKWNGLSWSALGTGMNGAVRALAFAPNGDLYAGGEFTTAGGVTVNKIAKWNGSSWSALGTGMDDHVLSLTIAPNGDLYAGGGFAYAGGVRVDSIAKWNGTSWSALGSGMNNAVRSLAFAPNGDLYAGGDFTAVYDGPSANRIAKWDGSTWSALGMGMNGSVYSLAFAPNGDLYAGGDFITAGGVTVNRIAKWDGSSWSALGAGMNGGVWALTIAPNGDLYAGGIFTTAGGLALLDRIAVWRGGAWGYVDIYLHTVANHIRAIAIDSNRLFIGSDFSVTIITSDQKTVTNSSNANVYPTIEITGPGVLQGFSNFTTGASIQFDGLTLQPGEVLTINLDPTNLKMTSTWRGNCLRYVNAGSDLGDFYLKPGDNSITFFMPSGTDSNTKAYLYYTPAFWNVEGALL